MTLHLFGFELTIRRKRKPEPYKPWSLPPEEMREGFRRMRDSIPVDDEEMARAKYCAVERCPNCGEPVESQAEHYAYDDLGIDRGEFRCLPSGVRQPQGPVGPCITRSTPDGATLPPSTARGMRRSEGR
jgi:hypothetical protein